MNAVSAEVDFGVVFVHIFFYQPIERAFADLTEKVDSPFLKFRFKLLENIFVEFFILYTCLISFYIFILCLGIVYPRLNFL